ncbi:MAG: hypothetical protein ACXVB0_19555 [Mucilaginibacter sp.]
MSNKHSITAKPARYSKFILNGISNPYQGGLFHLKWSQNDLYHPCTVLIFNILKWLNFLLTECLDYLMNALGYEFILSQFMLTPTEIIEINPDV